MALLHASSCKITLLSVATLPHSVSDGAFAVAADSLECSPWPAVVRDVVAARHAQTIVTGMPADASRLHPVLRSVWHELAVKVRLSSSQLR